MATMNLINQKDKHLNRLWHRGGYWLDLPGSMIINKIKVFSRTEFGRLKSVYKAVSDNENEPVWLRKKMEPAVRADEPSDEPLNSDYEPLNSGNVGISTNVFLCDPVTSGSAKIYSVGS